MYRDGLCSMLFNMNYEIGPSRTCQKPIARKTQLDLLDRVLEPLAVGKAGAAMISP